MAENRELALVLKLVADQFQSEMKKSGGLVGEMTKFIGDWKTQLTLVGTALFAIAKSTANFGEEALKTSQRLGLTVEMTTALQHAAHMADVPVRTLEMSLKTLSQNAVEAARGSGDGAKLFASLGVSATDASGKIKPLDQLFFEFQDRLRGVGSQAEFVNSGVTAFGRSFLELVPMIRQGSAATKEAMEEGRRFGVVMTQEQAVAASRFNDELKKLNAQATGLKLSLGNDLIPPIRQLIELFRVSGIGTGLSATLEFIHFNLLAINTALKDMRAGWQFLFGEGADKLTFSQLKEQLAANEAAARRELFERRHPGVLSPPPGSAVPGLPGGGAPSGGSLIVVDAGKEQERIGKAKQEIFQTNLRSLEIEQRQMAEVLSLWKQRATFFETHEQRTAEAEQRRAEGVQVLREFAEAEFARDEEMLAHAAEVQQRRGQMIFESTQLEIKLRDDAAKANQTFFDGWAAGMKKYIGDTDSGFGLAADMARRTAQTMEMNFRQFFFDLWDQKITSMMDVLRSLEQFAKQVMGTVFSQLATRAVLGAFGFGAAGGGEVVQRFAMGGPVFGAGNLDTVPALLTPGEFVLSRADVGDIKRGLGAGGGITVQVNNYSKSEVQAQDGGVGPDGKRTLYIMVRDVMRAATASGDMDRSMSQRYGLTPSPGRR